MQGVTKFPDINAHEASRQSASINRSDNLEIKILEMGSQISQMSAKNRFREASMDHHKQSLKTAKNIIELDHKFNTVYG